MSSSNTLAGPRLYAIPLIVALIAASPARAAAQETGTLYHHTGYLGSTVAWSDRSSNIIARIAMTPYGTPRITARDTGAPPGARFTGKAWEPRTGLYDFGARYHDPALGRFLSADAARQTSSPYPYVGASPLERVDPDGNMYLLYAREALSVAARELGHEEYQLVKDPLQRMEVAERARRYAFDRYFNIKAELRQAEAELDDTRFAMKKDLGPVGMSILNGIEYQARLFKSIRNWAREQAGDIEYRYGDYVPDLLHRARNIPLPELGDMPGWTITLQDIPEYREALSRIGYAATGEQQSDALKAVHDKFEQLYAKSGHPTALLGPISTDMGAAHSLYNRTVSDVAKRYGRYRRGSAEARVARLRYELEGWQPKRGDALWMYWLGAFTNESGEFIDW